MASRCVRSTTQRRHFVRENSSNSFEYSDSRDGSENGRTSRGASEDGNQSVTFVQHRIGPICDVSKKGRQGGTRCCVPFCTNSGGHRFPKDEALRKKWTWAVRKTEEGTTEEWYPRNHSVVCYSHFTPSDYITETSDGCVPTKNHLKKSVVPSVFAWTQTGHPSEKKRDERVASRIHEPDEEERKQEEMELEQRYVETDVDMMEMEKDGKHMRMLKFAKPGKFMEDFDPERSSREMRKMNRRIYRDSSRRSQLYDETGCLMDDNLDLCDCLEEHCPGCHFPCPKCGSEKCGAECRCNRRWVYFEVEVEGGNKKFQFKTKAKGVGAS